MMAISNKIDAPSNRRLARRRSCSALSGAVEAIAAFAAIAGIDFHEAQVTEATVRNDPKTTILSASAASFRAAANASATFA
jgi:hypothetical protein